MDEVFDRLTDRSIRVIHSINPQFKDIDHIQSGLVLTELYKIDVNIAAVMDILDISKQSSEEVDFADWLVTSYHEAFLIDSDIVDVHHLFFALLFQLDSESYYLAKKEFITHVTGKTDLALETYVEDLNKLVKKDKTKVIGRDAELTKLIVNLTSEETMPILLLGDSGCGKTTLMYELARKINAKEVPSELHNAKVYRIKLPKFLSAFPIEGNLPPGDFFSKLFLDLVRKEKSDSRLILFFDDLQLGSNLFIGFGPTTNDSGVSIVGAAQNEMSERLWDSPVSKIWNIIPFTELSEDDISDILAIEAKFYDDRGVIIPLDSIEKIIDIYKNDLLQGAMPGVGLKAFKTLEVYKKHVISNYSPSKKITKKEDLQFTVEVSDIEAYYDPLRESGVSTQGGASDIPLDKLINIEESLKAKIIGQDQAVESLSRALKISSLKLHQETKPTGCFLMLGPTGVGKTECAKALAGVLYGYANNTSKSPASFLRVDMAEYSERHTVSKLFGAPPGYVGYDDSGTVVDFVQDNGSSIILFDEIDKAHPEVLNSLLHIMDEAEIKNNTGETVSFENVIILMTSNHGAELINKNKLGYEGKIDDKTKKIDNIKLNAINNNEPEYAKELKENIKKQLKPEFINRFDEIIVFNKLQEDSLLDILDLSIVPMINSLKLRGVKLEVSKKARKQIILDSNYDEYGARDVKRVLRREVSSPVSDILLKNSKVSFIRIKATAGKYQVSSK